MESFSSFHLHISEGERKLERYRQEAALRHLTGTYWRSRLARGLRALAERLEPTPTLQPGRSHP